MRTSVKQNRIKAARLKGFQDYLPETMALRRSIMDAVRKEANISGFLEVGTPVLEYSEVLLGEGGETDKQVYSFEDNGGRKVGMRYDLTMSFARFIAEHQGDLIFPFKRMQIGDVWRAEKPQKGRYREFAQCDFDIIGIDTVAADVEVLTCLQRVLSNLNCGKFTMAMGNRVILSALIHTFYSDLAEGQEQEILIALDKLDKIGAEKVVEVLKKTHEKDATELLLLLEPDPETKNARIDKIERFLEGNEEALKEVSRFRKTYEILEGLSHGSQGSFVMNLSIARGLGYYTGVVFETTLDDLPGFGSISSGGRYNNLTDRFMNREMAGVGGSIGLDRLVAAMKELDISNGKDKKSIFIAVAQDEALNYAFDIAKTLRENNMISDISLKTGKLGNQFKLAHRKQCDFVVTVGEDEMQSQTFSIKDMAKGRETKNIPLGSLVDTLKNELA